ncbi:hypothetical protein HXX76_005759 [Chlamydomonas incerta]|uniref:MIB/HERC2 domain-containing protein n=1 Tax=Chlamydomonas incerta TaxID=51695 RepID=A0A835T665_CHLIN|nr:hypothetical protein HXX76_005759 [Chlamydomonas incerta]|eukprot:KAG2438151.1 hypothetical protein HXX76_005759 [Chlamydomonas incerta]
MGPTGPAGSRCASEEEQQASQAAAASVDTAPLQLRVSCLEGQQLAELQTWRQSQATMAQGAGASGTQAPTSSQPNQQQQQQQQQQEPAAKETAAVVGLVTTPGPYPGIYLPRTRPVPGEVVTADNVHVGLVVRRGPDWDRIHTNWIDAGRDGGPGSNGVVKRVSSNGRFADVRWPATGEETASFIHDAPGSRELVVAPAEAQPKKHVVQQKQEAVAAVEARQGEQQGAKQGAKEGPQPGAQPQRRHRRGRPAEEEAGGLRGRCSPVATLNSSSNARSAAGTCRPTAPARAMASAGEPAAPSSSPDVGRVGEQQQAPDPAPTSAPPAPPAADPHSKRAAPMADGTAVPAAAGAVTAALSGVVGRVVDARLAGVRARFVEEVVAALVADPELLLGELLLAMGKVPSSPDDAAELRRRVSGLEGRVEELVAALGERAGDASQAAASVEAAALQLRVSCFEGQVAELQTRRQSQGAGASGTQTLQSSQPNQQQPQQQEAIAKETEVEAKAEVGLVATPGPYPDIYLPRTRPVPGEVVTADNVHVGLVVRRGPDWDRIYDNWIAAGRDGGPGSNGVVKRVYTSGRTVSVRWPATGEETGCYIQDAPGWRELVVAPVEAEQGAQSQRRWLWWPW